MLVQEGQRRVPQGEKFLSKYCAFLLQGDLSVLLLLIYVLYGNRFNHAPLAPVKTHLMFLVPCHRTANLVCVLGARC
jgi:hypothetical protein